MVSAADLVIPETDDPKAYVAEVVRASGSSFARPMMVLPREKREAMLALYAFCRETDDVADEIEDLDESLRQLNAWRDEVEALYTGNSRHPVAIALAGPVERFGLPKKYFIELLNGFDMDRSGQMVRPELATLEQYCYRVACCVGLISVEIFEYEDAKILEFAEHLGHAFQLTNILRDIGEDAERGRIYLPLEFLDRHGMADVPPKDLMAHPGLRAVCAEIGALARRRFDQASANLPASEVRNMRPALLMRAVYESYLVRMEESDWHLSGDRVRLGKAAKIWTLLRAYIATL